MRKKLNRKQIRYLLLKEAKKEMLFEARKRKKYVEVIDHVLLENKNLINSKDRKSTRLNSTQTCALPIFPLQANILYASR